MLLDGKHRLICVTEEKRVKTLNMVQSLMDRKSATIKEIQSLAGLLNFLNRVIYPGRAFTRRMYSKLSGKLTVLKAHHHVKLDQEFKNDCRMWERFLTNCEKGICRPFIDLSKTLTAEILDFYTDSAKGENLGMGGIFNKHWFFAKWEVGYIKKFDPSIEYLELLAVTVGIYLLGGKYLRNKRIVVFCDNQAVVNMINSTASKCKNCMNLIRKMTLVGLNYNLRVFA